MNVWGHTEPALSLMADRLYKVKAELAVATALGRVLGQPPRPRRWRRAVSSSGGLLRASHFEAMYEGGTDTLRVMGGP